MTIELAIQIATLLGVIAVFIHVGRREEQFKTVRAEIRYQRRLNHWFRNCMVILGHKLGVDLPNTPEISDDEE